MDDVLLELRKQLASELREMLQEEKLTVQALSNKSGISKSYIYEILQKNANPRVDIILRLAIAGGRIPKITWSEK